MLYPLAHGRASCHDPGCHGWPSLSQEVLVFIHIQVTVHSSFLNPGIFQLNWSAVL
jgi:hypothetical protein